MARLVVAGLLALLASGCERPPVLTPLRLVDRGPAPLARTAELRINPSVYFEQPRDSSQHTRVHFTFDIRDVAQRPNTFITYAFTDSLALVVPGVVLWSPLVQPDRGLWLTLGGGVYGFGSDEPGFFLGSLAGAWLKRRFGGAFWLTGGLVTLHRYYSSWDTGDPDDESSSKHFLTLLPGVEAGVQLTDTCAVTLLADHSLSLVNTTSSYSRIRAELVLTHSWWLDIGLNGGIYLFSRNSLHADPLVGLTVTARW